VKDPVFFDLSFSERGKGGGNLMTLWGGREGEPFIHSKTVQEEKKEKRKTLGTEEKTAKLWQGQCAERRKREKAL